ncbi:MAG TPA: response regulator [Polyangiaceae bacterium]|nr:response regulator [Polyangiaceae bacterium]
MSGQILLVEDEFDTLELLGRSLERAGHRCLLAQSLSEALGHVAKHPELALVITDIVLGKDEHGGLELLKALGARSPHVPVIVTTAYADVEKLKVALNEGAAHFLEKPFRASELLTAVDRALGARRTRDVDSPEQRVERVFTQAKLTEKERAVARHLLEGRTSGEIAIIENNSPKTIRQHVSQIYAKCDVASRAEFFRLVYLK